MHRNTNKEVRSRNANRNLFQAFCSRLHPTRYTLHPQSGFTLMEIVVSTSIFATSLVLMFTLLNYTLKLNRRGEALRQATQGMRNFTEFLVKEVRNGTIDYQAGSASPDAPCSSAPADYVSTGVIQLRLISLSGERSCIYYDANFKAIMIKKSDTAAHSLNPANFEVSDVKFIVRPSSDPFGTTPPAVQPSVTVAMTFRVQIGNDPAVVIPYQTTISNDAYNIPK